VPFPILLDIRFVPVESDAIVQRIFPGHHL
jgi:hypothetical protein